MRFVKCRDFRGKPIAADSPVFRHDRLADVTGPQAIALHCQKRQLVGHVDPAEIGVELDAIENYRRIDKTDMLGPQITVAFDDAPPSIAGQRDQGRP